MAMPPAPDATRRLSGSLVVVVVLAVGIVYWMISAQAQRTAMGRLRQELSEARDETSAAHALIDDKQRDLVRLRARLESLEGAAPQE